MKRNLRSLSVEEALAALPEPFQEPCRSCEISEPHATYVDLDVEVVGVAPVTLQDARLHHRYPDEQTRTLIHTLSPSGFGADDDYSVVVDEIRGARERWRWVAGGWKWKLGHRLIIELEERPGGPVRHRFIQTKEGAFDST